MSWKANSVAFKCFGLDFTAEVRIYPGFPGDRYQPPEGPELEFKTLLCEGQDAYFMVHSEELLERLDDAAWDVLDNEYEPSEEEPEPEEPMDMTDVEADADTLASAGMGTDEDYGYFGE